MLCGDKITVDTSEAYSTTGRIHIHVNRKYHVERILPEQAVAFAGGGLEANVVDGGCSMMARTSSGDTWRVLFQKRVTELFAGPEDRARRYRQLFN